MTWRPGPLLLPALAIVGSPAVFAPWWPAFAPLALILVIGVGVISMIEALLLRRSTPHAELMREPVLSIGERERLAYHVGNPSAVAMAFRLRVRLPNCLGGGSAMTTMQCPAGRTVEAAVAVAPVVRGCEPLERPWIAWNIWGLAERIEPVGVPSTVTVLPNLRAVERMQRRLDALFLSGMGTRMAPRAGNGREFSRLREYVTGDDMRCINWKASARVDHLVVQEFRVERAQDILLVVDRSHLMAARAGALTWCDRAIDSALRLGAFANRFEDRVGACSFSMIVQPGPAPSRGSAHARRLTTFLGRVQPGAEPADWLGLAADLRRRLRNRTLLVIFTTLPERGAHRDLVRAMRALSARHLPLIIAFADPGLSARAATLPADRDDLCRAVVATGMVDGRAATVRELRESGVLVSEIDPSGSAEAAINGYLTVKRRQLL